MIKRDPAGFGGRHRPARSGARFGIVIGLLLSAAWFGTAGAVRTEFFRADSYDAFQRGRIEGVALKDDGTAMPAPEAVLLSDPSLRTIWALAPLGSDRLVLATGDEGQLVQVNLKEKEPESKVLATLFDTQTFALAADARGNLYAAGAPVGTVTRISPDGTARNLFNMPEGVVFCLLAAPDGSIYAGTGERGRLYKITPDGDGAVVAETGDLSLRCMAWLANGHILMGTDGRGLVEEFDPGSGKMRVLYDAAEEEIVSVAPAADGGFYFAANPGAGGAAGGGGGPAGPSGGGGRSDPPTEEKGSGAVHEPAAPPAVTAGPGGPGGSGGPTLYRMHPDGSVEPLWSCPEHMIHAVAVDPDGNALVATGEKACLYRVAPNGNVTLLWRPDEEQLLSILPVGSTIYAGTGNPGRLYRIGPGTASEGMVTSKIMDAGDQARWGTLSWDGFSMRGGNEPGISFETRSGFTDSPDPSWSDWTVAKSSDEGLLVDSPPARFLQWRVHFKADGKGGPILRRVSIAYGVANAAPRIVAFHLTPGEPTYITSESARSQVTQVLPGGVQIDYSLPSVGPPVVPTEDVPTWIRRIRSIVWDAQDPDGDNLVSRIEIRSFGETDWHTLADEVHDRAWSFESGMLPDGVYEIRLTVSDSPSNPPGTELTDEIISPPFHVDTTPPVVQDVKAKRVDNAIEITGTAVDSDSPIQHVDATVNGEDFHDLAPTDGLMDSPHEAFSGRIPLKPGDGGVWIVVRASDAAGNRGTYRAWLEP